MSCIEYPLCKYAHYENGSLVCLTGEPCSFQRYCSTLLKVIHTSAYKTCEVKKTLSKAKNIEPEKKVEENIIEKTEICKATYGDGKMYINFKGYGILIDNVDGHTEPEVEVVYVGEIGKRGFKYRIK